MVNNPNTLISELRDAIVGVAKAHAEYAVENAKPAGDSMSGGSYSSLTNAERVLDAALGKLMEELLAKEGT